MMKQMTYDISNRWNKRWRDQVFKDGEWELLHKDWRERGKANLAKLRIIIKHGAPPPRRRRPGKRGYFC